MQIIKNSKFQNIYIKSQPWIELKFRKSKNRKEVFESEILNPTDVGKHMAGKLLLECITQMRL